MKHDYEAVDEYIEKIIDNSKFYNVWDVTEKCWIPNNQVLISPSGKLYTITDDGRWAEEVIAYEIVWNVARIVELTDREEQQAIRILNELNAANVGYMIDPSDGNFCFVNDEEKAKGEEIIKRIEAEGGDK